MTLIKTSSTQAQFSRRKFLHAIGASSAILPLLHAETALGATPGTFPKRLVTMGWTNGVAQKNFYPATDADPTASDVLKPLAPLKAKVLLAAGVDYACMGSGHNYDGHFGFPVMFTGAYKNLGGQSDTADGPSIDQVVSDAVAKTVNLPMPLLVITANGSASVSWRTGAQRNTGEKDAGRLFKTLFSSASVPAGQIDTARSRSQSILDFVQGELKGFSAKMGTDDRAKIQAHLDAVRDLEMRLTATSSVACTPPTTSTSSTAYPDQVKAFMDITAVALRCDLTRSVSITLGADGGSNPGSFPFLGVSGDYHAIAHQGEAGYVNKVKIDTWYYQQVANLATALDSSMEGTGTVLDNSVIVVGNDMAEGSTHSTQGMQFLMVGSAGGYFKTGRVARLGSWSTKTGSYWKGSSGVAHNKLLAAIGTAMGLSIDGFGQITGVLSELKA